MAKVLKLSSPIVNKFTGELSRFGKETLVPGAELILEFDGLPGYIQVFIQGTNTADYMIGTSNDSITNIEALTAEYLDTAGADISVDDDVEVEANITAAYVINRGTSTDDIIVLWRF